MKYTMIFMIIQIPSVLIAQSKTNGNLKGCVVDKETGEFIPFANITIESNGKQIGYAVSNVNGYYYISSIWVDICDIKAKFIHYKDTVLKNVTTTYDDTTFLDITLTPLSDLSDSTIIYNKPIIDIETCFPNLRKN